MISMNADAAQPLPSRTGSVFAVTLDAFALLSLLCAGFMMGVRLGQCV